MTPEQRRRAAEILLQIEPAHDYASLRNASNVALRAEFEWSEEEAEDNLGQMCLNEVQSALDPIGGPLAQDEQMPQARVKWIAI